MSKMKNEKWKISTYVTLTFLPLPFWTNSIFFFVLCFFFEQIPSTTNNRDVCCRFWAECQSSTVVRCIRKNLRRFESNSKVCNPPMLRCRWRQREWQSEMLHRRPDESEVQQRRGGRGLCCRETQGQRRMVWNKREAMEWVDGNNGLRRKYRPRMYHGQWQQ